MDCDVTPAVGGRLTQGDDARDGNTSKHENLGHQATDINDRKYSSFEIRKQSNTRERVMKEDTKTHENMRKQGNRYLLRTYGNSKTWKNTKQIPNSLDKMTPSVLTETRLDM